MNNENNNLNNENNSDVSVDNFFDPQTEENESNIPLGQENNMGFSNDVPTSMTNDNLSPNTELNTSMQTGDTEVNNDFNSVASNNSGVNTEMNDVGMNAQQDVMPNNNGINTSFNVPNNFDVSDTNNSIDNLNSSNSDNTSDLQRSINVEQPNIKNDVSSSVPQADTNIDMNSSIPVNPTINMEQPTANPEPMNNLNNMSGQNQNVGTPSNITVVNKKSNKGLIIVLVVVIILAVASAIGAYFLIINKDSNTKNDFETNNNPTNTNPSGTSTADTTSDKTSSDTIENDGFIYTKKSGYNYEIESGVLYAYSNSSAFQFIVMPAKYENIVTQTNVIEDVMTESGVALSNKKESSYDGIKALSYEALYEGHNVLYFVYPINNTNYSMQVLAFNKANTINYDLITEAMKLTEDIKKSGSSTYSKKNSDLNVATINDNLFK